MKTQLLKIGRVYRIAVCDPIIEIHTVTSTDLFEEKPETSEMEYVYALRDIIDEVLRLERGQSIYFKPNRDNGDAKGILKRLS